MTTALRRWVGWLTLSAFLGAFALPLSSASHLPWGDDADCGPSVALAANRPAQLDTPTTPAPHDHCALCHLLREISGAAPVPAVSVPPRSGSAQVAVLGASRPYHLVTAVERPSRAPPSTPAL
jgi:hypothetical protein